MIDPRYFLTVVLLVVLFEPLTVPPALQGEGLNEEQMNVQSQQDGVSPVRNSSGTSNPTGITLGPDSASERQSTLSNGVNIEERWGIQILSIRLSANDHMLDFRYRVIDPEKAHMLTQKQINPYLIDQATGKKLNVARTRLGPMRQTTVKPISGRNYAILFGNTNKMVKAGSKVTVVIADFKAENLVVE